MDKRVPVALIFAIVIQTATAVWWVGNLSNRVDNAAEANIRQDARITAAESMLNTQAVNSATLTAQLSALAEGVRDLKATQAETNRLLRGLSAGAKE